jgi:hypothetical protein
MAELALRSIGAFLAAYGAAYLLIAIASPKLFLDWFAVDASERRGSKRWQVWIRIGLTALGLGLFLYFAAYSMSRAIPYDWGSVNEDGEWEYARSGFQIMFAFYGTVMIVTTVEKQAEMVVNREIIATKMRALEDAIKFYGDEKVKRVAQEREREKLLELQDQSNCEHLRSICAGEIKRIDWDLASGSGG